MTVKENVCDFENLYKAMCICRRNVMWKDSTAGFVKNGLTNCYKLKDELMSGKYKIGAYTVFKIYEPKERVIVSTRIKDRVFQRSLCDNYLTEQITKSFIYDNCACQKGKGTDFARERLKCHMQRFYRKSGLNGYIIKCDISDYFGSTPHSVACAAVRKRVSDDWAYAETERIINSFTQGVDPSKGMGLGSQVTQLIQLAVLDDIDHLIKEQLGIKYYVRYMDDFILIHQSKEYLTFCKEHIGEELEKLGLKFSKKKTQLFPIKQPIHFLGFSFRLTSTGKVIMRVLPEKVTKARCKLAKLVQLCERGTMSREQVDECFKSWVSHASKGNCYKLIESMKEYYYNLWRE
jgi:RNA-directed DNA polymerase|nr:MAG TPA: hypothetical protein [Caudoviricetes sp.]